MKVPHFDGGYKIMISARCTHPALPGVDAHLVVAVLPGPQSEQHLGRARAHSTPIRTGTTTSARGRPGDSGESSRARVAGTRIIALEALWSGRGADLPECRGVHHPRVGTELGVHVNGRDDHTVLLRVRQCPCFGRRLGGTHLLQK